MKREKTKNLGFIDKAYPIELESLPKQEAEQLVLCAQEMNRLRRQRDETQRLMDVQKAEIIDILRRLHRNPLQRDLCLYSDTPSNWVEDTDEMPDGIIICTSAQYTQQRLDTMKLKRLAPETYKAYLKTIKCKGKILTGKELLSILNS